MAEKINNEQHDNNNTIIGGEEQESIHLMTSTNEQEELKIDFHKNMKFPPKDFGTKSVVPHYIFDELDITIRYTIFVASFTALYLYNYEWGKQELPLVYIALAIVTLLSIKIPYLGSFVSYSISFLFGSLTSIAVLILITYIVGHHVTVYTYDSPTGNYTCEFSESSGNFTAVEVTKQVEADKGDPDTVLYAFLMFIATFLFIHFGRSVLWIKGAVMTLNIYGSIWFLGMKEVAYTVPSNLQFLIYLRTTVIGIGFFLVCLLIPLPRFFHSLIPHPRISSSVIISNLQKSQTSFSDICSALLQYYRYLVIDPTMDDLQHDDVTKRRYSKFTMEQQKRIAIVSYSSKLYLKDKLDALGDSVLKLKTLYNESAKWEAFWWNLTSPHCISGDNMMSYLTKFNVAIIHAKMMVRTLDDIHYHLDSESFPPPLENADEFDRVLKLADRFIQQSFKTNQNFESCCVKGNYFGCCHEGEYFGGEDSNSELSEYEFIDLCESLEKLLTEEKYFSYDSIFDQIPEDQSASEKSRLSSSLPSSFPRLFFILNFIVILKLTKSLEDISKNIINDSEYDDHHYYYPQKKELTKLSFLQNIITSIFEYPKRLMTWFTSYIDEFKADYDTFKQLLCFRSQYPEIKLFLKSIFQVKKFLMSFIISAAITVASLFLYVDYFRSHVSSTITIIITIVTTVEPANPGTSIIRSIYRLAGTLVSVALSFLVLALFTNHKNATFGASVLFAFIARFIASKEKFSEIATVFLTTTWIILYSGTLDLTETLILPTIAARGIGVGIGVVIAFGALFLWPINPNLQLRYNSIKLLLVPISHSIKKILSPKKHDEPKLFYDKWMKRIDKRMNDILFQYNLAVESREEFHFFRAYNFPYHDFNQFIRLERRLCGDSLWLEFILYYLRRSNEEIRNVSPEFQNARNQFYSAIRFCIGEIAEKIYRDHVSPFLVHYHLKRAFYEYSEHLRAHLSKLNGNTERIQIIRFHSLLYTYSMLIDTINKLDRKAERIVAYNRARKDAGVTLFF